MTDAIMIPLKLKYRFGGSRLIKMNARKGTDNIEAGTLVYSVENHIYKARTNAPVKKGRSLMPRRRAWGPW